MAGSGWYQAPGSLMGRLGSAGETVLAHGRLRSLDAGTTLIRQGEADTDVFVLGARNANEAACVKVSYFMPNGTESILGIRGAGEVVGELAGLQGTTRGATVVAITRLVVRQIGWTDFCTALHGCPGGWETFSLMISEQLAWANSRRVGFTTDAVVVRLARALGELAERPGFGPGRSIRLSQRELGMLIGARPVAVSRALNQLREIGAIETGYRQSTVVDMAALDEFITERS